MIIVAINGNGEVVQEAKLPTSEKALEDFFSLFTEPTRAVVGKELAKIVCPEGIRDDQR